MPPEIFAEELAFWDRELSLQGDYAEGVRWRLDPERMHLNYPPEMLSYLGMLRNDFAEKIEVLDVGSGPLSMLALGARQGNYGLTCVDPLADEYMALLGKYGHEPPWPLVRCRGEELTGNFPDSSFHLVWSSNALDHTQNPREVMRNVSKLLKPDGLAIIQVWECEGSAQNWSGLHQHDFKLSENGALLSRRRENDILSGFEDVVGGLPLRTVESLTYLRDGRNFLRAVFRKTL
jgi:SAM-dependent methyltransferase